MIRILFCLLITFALFAFAIDQVLAEPLGGWDTFPGPAPECAGDDC